MDRLLVRHYVTGQPMELSVSGQTICDLQPVQGLSSSTLADLPWLAPSFCDPQINGAGGISFLHPTRRLTPHGTVPVDPAQALAIVMQQCQAHGIGLFLPTLITASFDTLHQALRTWEKVFEQSPRWRPICPGYHLEGPYLSAEDGPRGAHPRQHVRDPDWDEFQRLQEAANGRIRLMTLAPERPGALRFIEKLTAAGVIAAIGHTAADPGCIRQAVAAGARLSTHLGNGCHAVLPRHDNYLWEQLACDQLWASIICDGFHLPPAVVRCIVRCKTPERLLLTCDASSLAGLPAGRYREWDTDIEVQADGKVALAGTPFLAGSGLFIDTCVANVARDGPLSLAQALDLATTQPRRLLGLPLPELSPGQPAECITFRWQPGGPLTQVRYWNQ
ncbi:MAG: N-acetylglucosamine-6-phosphate deacetylase [Gemmataceae bacterium]|nr:N-acetylglucosamine-6-phosphate deacetylase [Gemmataceae bacterium]MCS7271221.1 N-acetylglucosamine-6-phosphate deacetylase [Gemmataceae bacterium]MDW8242750.1 N-acetylglucosamine-6-phosphate deacetylase [Thermogemmata sp.]